MPSPQKSRRVDQCCYSEGGRRCRRSATGNPPLCNAHKIAVAEQVRREVEPPGAGAGVYELFDRVVTGRRVSRKVFEEAASDIADWWTKYQAESAKTDSDPTRPRSARSAPASGPNSGPKNWWDPIVNEVKHRAQTRQPDPRAVELKQRRARARVTLGVAMDARLSEADLNKLRRELARKHHPDRGGSASKMQEINDAVDVLLAELVT